MRRRACAVLPELRRIRFVDRGADLRGAVCGMRLSNADSGLMLKKRMVPLINRCTRHLLLAVRRGRTVKTSDNSENSHVVAGHCTNIGSDNRSYWSTKLHKFHLRIYGCDRVGKLYNFTQGTSRLEWT